MCQPRIEVLRSINHGSRLVVLDKTIQVTMRPYGQVKNIIFYPGFYPWRQQESTILEYRSILMMKVLRS
jgi:hypothetical protein